MAGTERLEGERRRGFAETMGPYLRPRPLAALLLGISSGFPLALLLGTMTFWLAKVGIEKKTIGFAIGLTTPYTLKFLWAPLIDRLKLPVLTRLFGQRRSWLFLIQALLFASVWMLGASQPELHLGVFAFWAIVTAFLAATQDIVIDAYRIEILPEAELPHGTANNQFGYRLGAFIAGVGTIAMASPEGLGLGWAMAYGLTGLCVLPGALAAFWAGPGLHDRVLEREPGQRAGAWLETTLIGPFREFLQRRGAVLILLFVLIYKLGDAMGQSMLNPMIVELGFSDTEFLAIKPGLAPALHSGDPAFDGLSGYLLEKLGPALGSLLDAATAAGEIRADVSPQDLLYAVAKLCAPLPDEEPDYGRRMVALLVDGLRPGGIQR